jgi:hypothetical protein
MEGAEGAVGAEMFMSFLFVPASQPPTCKHPCKG